MKKLIFGLLVSVMILATVSAVLADKGGVPNCYGQMVVSYAHKDGGVGPYRNSDSAAKNTDYNGDGKTNGQDLAWIIANYKENVCP